MNSKDVIKTTKYIYPQIYAYTLPEIKKDNGWVKIGYTERKNVDERIYEQTHTAAINLNYSKKWEEPAKFNNSTKWFKDKDLHRYLRKFKQIKQRKNTEWFYYGDNIERSHSDFFDFINGYKNQTKDKENYYLRPEQKAAVNKTMHYMEKNDNGTFLWNAKPRFGKSLTTFDLIIKIKAKNALILTNRPAIANSWFDDFEKFISWKTNYKFVSTSDSLKDRPTLSRDEYLDELMKDDKVGQIAFLSLQDLKGSIFFGGSYNKLSWVKDLNWDIVIIDESHEGVDTIKSDVALEQIKRSFTLHLSGTPFKEIASGDFSDDQIFNWTYLDEQSAKKNFIGEDNPYLRLPKMNMFTYQMSNMIVDKVNDGANIQGQNFDYAFDLNEFFATDSKKKFIHEEDVKKWLDTLTKNEKYPYADDELRNKLKHTLWLLNRVDSATALKKCLEKHEIFKNYKIVLAAGKQNSDDELSSSLERVRKAIKDNDKTITLSVGQLTTGVTIPEWTAVMMLSNLKSPSQYMQAAFRSQNPWIFYENGNLCMKENAYVFDFAPERTLVVYDEFANELSTGGDNLLVKKNNIKKMLNFFPVISEDNEGKMKKLNEEEVLTIPKKIKSTEVVSRGFMSNFLFQNISSIFSNNEVKEILDKLNPDDSHKKIKDPSIDPRDVSLDDEGNIKIPEDLVISTTKANFGNKVYSDIPEDVDISIYNDNLFENITKNFQKSISDEIGDLAREKGISKSRANKIVKKEAENTFSFVKKLQKSADIEINKLNIGDEKENSGPINDKVNEIKNDFKKRVNKLVQDKSHEILDSVSKKILEESENNKKNTVEDDVRARLRGFSRTIPSFLMAYGNENTTLSNFDKEISDNVFKEVTGISLKQFSVLRDEYKFFNESIFNQSVQEFIKKKYTLCNYFENENNEDIFDFIPPQKTNQIYTPKKVVNEMINKLEREDPNCFSDPNKTFADLYVKSGLYLTGIVKKLYKGLEDEIPNENDRIKHIFEKQIYGFAPTEIIYRIAKSYIFAFNNENYQIKENNIVLLDTTRYLGNETELDKKCNELFGRDKNEI
ncbi:hypothetical protein LAKU_13c00310 [Apilactobacillus kunkeei EFB6]|uniref:Uncharacterized protein n=1 Tax=Apilactobacillus kunkeei EFB6 TaxID=1419324 RepID=A0A837ADT7_9LACO|nr:DEAD/DEAH box helicase family protein [Apilactobacillus kunkeei]KDB00835.1 hypothetical protein LAKU_13c00310 [Apilactobacillus kunkeei EFB6]CAI2555630.1 hypothetical protein AKUH3B203M_01120 [Apilactobacillus kunkeei]CAI2801029.1 hypothetical protein AKUH3B203M04_05940 [Apilactobacillus kunkeei]